MAKRGKMGRLVLLLLAVVLVYLGIRLYPVWKAAVYLEKQLDMEHCAYEMEVVLDREAFPEGSDRAFKIMAELTGLKETDLYKLTMKGEVWEDLIHILVFPGEASAPLAELYLGNDIAVINETMLYNTIRDNLVEKYALLGTVMPRQEETLYITLEQTEQLFGLDLGKVRDFRLDGINTDIGAGGYFLLLAVMSRERGTGADCFTLATDHVELEFEIPGEGAVSSMKMELQVQNPSELVEKMSFLASWMGLPTGKQLNMVKSFAFTMTPGSERITVPGDYVNQNVVELLSRIREWVVRLMRGEEEVFENLNLLP